MTNKPMLSVERELLERLTENWNGTDARIELRALLDKPVAERKPFAWYRVPKDFPLQGAFFPYIEGRSERDIQNSIDAEFGFYVKRLYDEPAAQHQGEPGAWAIQWGSVIPGCRGHREAVLKHPGALDAVITPLFAEQPAPVAVVMPERESFDIDDWAGSFCQEALSFGMNQDVFARCVRTAIDRTLAEVARLNGVQP